MTTTDFVRIVAERRPKARTPVSEYMSTDVATAAADDSVAAVADAMLDRGVHHMPVVDDVEGVVGVVTTADLAGYVSRADRPGS